MKVHELLSSPDKWTKGALQRDKDGKPTNKASAVCYCLIGALDTCYDSVEDIGKFTKAMFKIKETTGVSQVSHWNDAPERTWQEVHDLCVKLDI